MNLVPVALMLLVATGPLNPKTPASIGGTVVMRDTGTPAKQAVVTLFRPSEENAPTPDGKPLRQDWPSSVKTDKNGKFVFGKVPPGNYRIAVSRTSNFVLVSDDSFGSATDALFGSIRGIPVSAKPGDQIQDLRIEVKPAASISGRILDHKGKPAEGVSVTALTASYENGRRILFGGTRKIGGIMARARTDRRGEYRIDGLEPGQYFVSANNSLGIGGWLQNADWCNVSLRVGGIAATGSYGGDVDIPARAWRGPAIFFPGVQNPADATPVDLHMSANRDHVDFRVEETPVSRILPALHGTVIDAATEKRAQNAEVWVTPIDGGPDSCLIEADKGSFDSTALRPGKYLVSANVEAPVRLAGRIMIEITDKPPKNLTIPVAPLFHVRGHIVVEGQSATSSDLDLSRFSVNLQPDPVVNSARLAFAPVSRDGTFDIQSLMGWDYRVSLRSPEPNTYIQSIRLGGEDILTKGFHLDSQPTVDLEIVIRKDAGAVSGVATIGAPRPPGNPMNVVLVPDLSQRNRQDLYRTAALSEKGEFEMNGLPPGGYRLFAWERVIEGAWTDPQFLKLFEDEGTPVQIRAGETASATVKPIAPWK